jgi:ABC-type sugar transport system permease subunit
MGYGTAVAVTMLFMVIVFSGVARLLMRREKVEF